MASAAEKLARLKELLEEKEALRKKLEEEEELTEEEIRKAEAELTLELEELRRDQELHHVAEKVAQLEQQGRTPEQIMEDLESTSADVSLMIRAQKLLDEREEQDVQAVREPKKVQSIDDLVDDPTKPLDQNDGMLYQLAEGVMGGDLYRGGGQQNLYQSLQDIQQRVQSNGMTDGEYSALQSIENELKRQQDQQYRVGDTGATDPRQQYIQRELAMISSIKQAAFADTRESYHTNDDGMP